MIEIGFWIALAVTVLFTASLADLLITYFQLDQLSLSAERKQNLRMLLIEDIRLTAGHTAVLSLCTICYGLYIY